MSIWPPGREGSCQAAQKKRHTRLFSLNTVSSCALLEINEIDIWFLIVRSDVVATLSTFGAFFSIEPATMQWRQLSPFPLNLGKYQHLCVADSIKHMIDIMLAPANWLFPSWPRSFVPIAVVSCSPATTKKLIGRPHSLFVIVWFIEARFWKATNTGLQHIVN